MPPKILHNLCFSFLLGIIVVPREIENNAYATFFGGQIRCIMGDVQVVYEQLQQCNHREPSLLKLRPDAQVKTQDLS